MLLGIEEQVLELVPDDNPGDIFPCLPCEGIHRELRAQLYAQLLGIFFDEAESLELLTLEFGPYGPYVFKLDITIVQYLAELAEDDIDNITASWAESSDMSSLHVNDEDQQELLSRFIYNLMHFCILMRQETVLSVFIYSNG